MDDQRALTTESSSTKPLSFGIRVLIVDDDATCLKIVEVMLQKFQYEVAAFKHAPDALAILRERQGGFDIILTDLHMPGMDGIALLHQVEVEFKIPVVMMSSDTKVIAASRCLEKGASFYLTKPLTRSNISNLWQFVFLEKRVETNTIEQVGRNLEIPSPEEVSREDTEHSSPVNDSKSKQEPRKKLYTKKEPKKGELKVGNFTHRYSRVVWSNGLHNKFLDAINKIGLHKAVPIKILEVMNHPGLTRENVASHLQKYRIFLRRLKQASRSSERNNFRSLSNKSSFSSGQPSALDMLEQGFSGICEQEGTQKSLQSRSKRGSTSGVEVENSLQKRIYKNLEQPSLDIISNDINQQNDGTSSSFQMESSNIRVGSSLYGGIPNTFARDSDALAMIHQQSQERMGHFARGSLDHSFNTTRLLGDNIQNVGSMFNNLNHSSNFSYIKNGFAGIQMNSNGNLIGFNQMPIGQGPSNSANSGYSRMDEIRNGKKPIVDNGNSPPLPGIPSSHFDYAAEVLAPFGGLVPQGSISSGRFEQLPLLSPPPPLPPPPPPLPQQQQNGTEAEEVDRVSEFMKSNYEILVGEPDSIFEFMKNDSPFENFPFAPSIDVDINLDEILASP
ncbi:hypothetical protein NE237_012698 [Protea cynaroides]|uniref:Response regulatory domain-containing protein n=1 Tax=Protea cynaroides TaxID=273540 RepID=A0A9Q0H0L8_9MAGN|nr:hypothetical protein NE237_012698 [Protea cynaroides]